MNIMTKLLIATGDSFVLAVQKDAGYEAAEALKGQGIRCIAVDPADEDILFAGSDSNGAWKSADGGRSWQQLDLPESNVYSVAVSAADGSVYAGTEPSKLFRSVDGGRSWRELSALRAIPSAPTWSFPPRPWTSHVRWIAPNPANADLILAGIELGGVMVSDDGGQTWLDHRPGAIKDAHELAWHPVHTDRAYEAGGGGTAWSADGGRTWRTVSEGRDRHYVWALAVDPLDPDLWYVSAAHGPSSAHSGYYSGDHRAHAVLYRWRGQGPWEPLKSLTKADKVMPYALATTESRLIAGFADGSLFASGDKGDSWQQLAVEGDAIGRIAALIAAKSDG
jgi:hypothetical protein